MQIEPASCSYSADVSLNDKRLTLSTKITGVMSQINARLGLRSDRGDNTRFYIERKLDGLRYLWQIRPQGATFNYLTSRRISTVTKQYVEKQDKVPHLRDFEPNSELLGAVFDGELTSEDGISSDTQHAMVTGDVSYTVWDIYYFKGMSLSITSLCERRRILSNLFAKYSKEFNALRVNLMPAKSFRTPDGIIDTYLQFLREGSEGAILKPAEGTLITPCWAKLKPHRTYDCVVTGVKWPTEGKYLEMGVIGALSLGMYKKGKLVDVGFASGMTDVQRALITRREKEGKLAGTVVEIEAQAQLPSGKFRHPRFLRFRHDKNATSCVFVKPGVK